jgi:hypothetical protein
MKKILSNLNNTIPHSVHLVNPDPQVTPKTLVIKAASDLTSALKGMVSSNGAVAEALQKFSELFTKIATAKSELAKAKEQQNNFQNHPNAHQAVPLPRVAERPSTPASSLACIGITKPKFEISAAKLATRKFPLIWLCKMANFVLGKQGKLLEYCHLIAYPKTQATWTHSYGDKLGWLAQEMLGRVTGTDTIFFIPKNKVLRARAKDITYGLITCLIRPEKTNEPNQTRLVAGGDRVHYPFNAGTPTANFLNIKLLINSMIFTPNPGQDSSQWTSRISTYVLP